MECEVHKNRPLLDKSIVDALLFKLPFDSPAFFEAPNVIILHVNVINQHLIKVILCIFIVLECELVLIFCNFKLFFILLDLLAALLILLLSDF